MVFAEKLDHQNFKHAFTYSDVIEQMQAKTFSLGLGWVRFLKFTIFKGCRVAGCDADTSTGVYRE